MVHLAAARPAQTSTYSRCSARTCSRASVGSDSQSRSWTTISEPVPEREVDVPVDERPQRGPRAVGGADRSRPTSSSRSLIETSISASTASLDAKCL